MKSIFSDYLTAKKSTQDAGSEPVFWVLGAASDIEDLALEQAEHLDHVLDAPHVTGHQRGQNVEVVHRPDEVGRRLTVPELGAPVPVEVIRSDPAVVVRSQLEDQALDLHRQMRGVRREVLVGSHKVVRAPVGRQPPEFHGLGVQREELLAFLPQDEIDSLQSGGQSHLPFEHPVANINQLQTHWYSPQ